MAALVRNGADRAVLRSVTEEGLMDPRRRTVCDRRKEQRRVREIMRVVRGVLVMEEV